MGGLKYYFTINQKAVIENGLCDKLDLTDLALFDFIYDFFNCQFDKKITFIKDNVEYCEIRLSLIEEQMPILKFGTKRTFITRMNKLIDAGLIERYEGNQNENRSAYRRGKNFNIFKFDTPMKQISQPCEANFTPPMKQTSHNNNIDDNNINNNKEISTNVDIKKDETSSCLTEYQRFDNWVKNNAPYCYKNMKAITEAEYEKMSKAYKPKQICFIIEQIENRKDLRKRYTNLYRTVLNWAKKEYGDKGTTKA